MRNPELPPQRAEPTDEDGDSMRSRDLFDQIWREVGRMERSLAAALPGLEQRIVHLESVAREERELRSAGHAAGPPSGSATATGAKAVTELESWVERLAADVDQSRAAANRARLAVENAARAAADQAESSFQKQLDAARNELWEPLKQLSADLAQMRSEAHDAWERVRSDSADDLLTRERKIGETLQALRADVERVVAAAGESSQREQTALRQRFAQLEQGIGQQVAGLERRFDGAMRREEQRARIWRILAILGWLLLFVLYWKR